MFNQIAESEDTRAGRQRWAGVQASGAQQDLGTPKMQVGGLGQPAALAVRFHQRKRIAEERQQAMAHMISRRGRLSVVQLAEQFEVTTETVRRDLSTLDRMGLVRRVHGGAVPAGSLTVIESGIVERDQSNTQAKEAIRVGFIKGYTAVAEADIRGFFDNLDWALLMKAAICGAAATIAKPTNAIAATAAVSVGCGTIAR